MYRWLGLSSLVTTQSHTPHLQSSYHMLALRQSNPALGSHFFPTRQRQAIVAAIPIQRTQCRLHGVTSSLPHQYRGGLLLRVALLNALQTVQPVSGRPFIVLLIRLLPLLPLLLLLVRVVGLVLPGLLLLLPATHVRAHRLLHDAMQVG